MFIQYFIEAILSKKCCPNWEVGKKDKREMALEGRLSVEVGLKPIAHHGWGWRVRKMDIVGG